MTGPNDYTKEEAQKRFETALRGGLRTLPKPHAEMKLGNSKAKKAKSPAKQKPKKA